MISANWPVKTKTRVKSLELEKLIKIVLIIGVRKVSKDPSNSIEIVYLVSGLKFKLLWVSQVCDKQNKVSF